MRAPRWTEEEDIWTAKLRESGFGARRIGRLLGRSIWSVRAREQRLRDPRPIVLSKWTDEAKTAIHALWASGLTARQISEQFPQFTRNSILGHLHRLKKLGLRSSRNPGQVRVINRARRAAAKPPRPSPRVIKLLPLEIAAIPDPVVEERISLVDLQPHHCRYPLGDSPHQYCGRQKHVTTSYCPQHARLCHV